MEGSKRSFVYNVEILIEDESHQYALIQLLKKLNSLDVIDYKILSGIELGNEIDTRKQKATTQKPVPVSSEPLKPMATKREAKKGASTAVQKIVQSVPGLDQLKQFKEQNKLIRIIVNRGLGVKLSIPCRILNMDEDEFLISVYHVDEKQVYTFRLIEIEDIIES